MNQKYPGWVPGVIIGGIPCVGGDMSGGIFIGMFVGIPTGMFGVKFGGIVCCIPFGII